MPNIAALVTVAAVMFAIFGAITLIAHIYNRNGSMGKQSRDTKDLPPYPVHAKEMA